MAKKKKVAKKAKKPAMPIPAPGMMPGMSMMKKGGKVGKC